MRGPTGQPTTRDPSGFVSLVLLTSPVPVLIAAGALSIAMGPFQQRVPHTTVASRSPRQEAVPD